jgi:hypothetical protein
MGSEIPILSMAITGLVSLSEVQKILNPSKLRLPHFVWDDKARRRGRTSFDWIRMPSMSLRAGYVCSMICKLRRWRTLGGMSHA